MFEDDQVESFGDFLTRTSGTSATSSQGFGDFLRKPKKKDAALKSDPYGPEVPEYATAPPIDKPANRPVALKPITSREMRYRDAARTIRKIEAGRQRAVSLFQEADRTPDYLDTISVPEGKGAFGLKDSTGQRMTQRQTLRARAEGELETANRLGEEAAKKYGDIVEVGFGKDTDPKSNRRWVYAKPKNANVEFWRKPSLEEQAAASTREEIDQEIDRQNSLKSQRKSFNEAGTFGQYAEKLATRYLSGRPDLTPQEREELAIRRQAEGVGVDRQGQPLGSEEPGFTRDWMNRGSQGLLSMIPSGASGLAHLSDTIYRQAQNLTGNRLPQADEWGRPVEKWARGVSDTIAPALPVDPARNEDFTSKLASGVGSAIGFGAISKLASFARIPSQVAIGTAGAGLGVDEIIQDARAAGFDPTRDPDRWDRMVALGGASGMTEIFGFGKMLDRWGLKRPFIKRALEVLEEFGQEGWQQYLGNVNAAYVGQFDPNRPLGRDVLENAIIGGIIGGGAQVAEIGSEALNRRAEARAVAKEPLQPLNLQPSVPAGTDTQVVKMSPGFMRKAAGLPDLTTAAPGAAQPATPATAPTIPVITEPTTSTAGTTAQPGAPLALLFPEAQQQAPQVDISTLPPQQRVAALVDQIRQQKEGRARVGLEQLLNQEYSDAGAMIAAASESWDTNRPAAEQLAATGAARLKSALQNLQKSEAYQAELGAVSTGTAQPGPYMAAAQSIQSQLDQVSALSNRDAERERIAREQQNEADKQQAKAEKEAFKQQQFQNREQQKLQRQLVVEQKKAETLQRQEQATARRMAAAEVAKENRRQQLERMRQQSRNEQAKKQADIELQRMGQHDAALQAADEAGRRHQDFLNQGKVAEAINELIVQQNQLRDAVRYLPKNPASQNTKADLNRYQGQIGNRIGDLRKQQQGRSVPVTQAIPPLFRADAVVNPEGGIPDQKSFYEPGAIFDSQTFDSAEEDETPLLTFIRQNGGIRDDETTGGELRRLGVRESGTTGLVNNRTGLAPDRMREALAESGYLPQDSTVDDLYQVIEAELRAGQRPREEESFSEFYERQEPGRSAPEGERRETSNSFTSFVEQFGDETDAEDMAALRRVQERSQKENPRDYDERTRPGEPGSGGVSLSPYSVLQARNSEAESQLYNSLPGSPEFRAAERAIYRDAEDQGIAERHAGAMIASALNYHQEKFRLEERGLNLDDLTVDILVQTVEDLTRQEQQADATIQREIARLPLEESEWVESQIRAINALFDTVSSDPDMMVMLENAIEGGSQQEREFVYAAGRAYGFDAEIARQFVQQQRRRNEREEESARVADRATEATYRREKTPVRQDSQPKDIEPLYELLSQNPTTISDVKFDQYLTSLEDWRNDNILGSDFGGVDLPPSLERELRIKISATNKERQVRVKEKRLSAKHTPLPIPTPEHRAERQKLMEDTRDLPLEEQAAQMAELRARQRETGEYAEPLGKEDLGRAMREQLAREAETVSHPNPAIDGKPVIARTDDGRVVVENPDNKSGVSVVKDQAQVKMMLTRDDRQQLADLGYSRSDIDSIKPDEGQRIIEEGRTKSKSDPTEKTEPETAKQPQSERGRLAVAVADFLATGKFTNIIEARKFIGNITGKQAKPGTVEAKQVDEAVEAGGVIAAQRIVDAGMSPQETFRALLDLHNRLPNLNVRTSTSMIQQAYSTPLPIAYVAAHLAGINQQTSVYEPTAGHAALLITADPAKVTANELNDDRNEALHDILPEAEITQNDASEWRPDVQVDRVITNPPFGAIKDDNGKSRRFDIDGKYETSEIDHAIAFEALKTLKDNGKAALIVAGVRSDIENARSNAYNVGAKRNFYFTLYNQYNVVDHFTVSGDLYAKQGAGWPVDVIIIDGRGKATRSLPAVEVPRILKTWDELEGKLNARDTARQTVADSADQNVRLGERGLSESERDSRAGERATNQPSLFGLPTGQSGADDSRRNVRPGSAELPGGTTLSGEPTRTDSRRQRQEGSAQRDDIQQPAPGRKTERTGSVSGQVDAEQGQSKGAADNRRDQSGTVDQRTDRGVGRTSDVEGVFDEEFEKLFGEVAQPQAKSTESKLNKTPENVRESKNAQPLKDTAKSAVKESGDTLREIAKGLSELFGGPKVSSGLTFDEKTYAAAKPHFEKAMQHFQQAARDVREVMSHLLKALNEQFGFAPDVLQRMKPYIVRFVEEQTAQPQEKAQNITKTITAPATTTSEADAGASDTHRPYKPASKSNSVDTLVPVNMANAVENSLKRLQDEVGDLDEFVADRLGYDAADLGKYFSGEQVDALSMAIRNIENGGALIVGDQTGIGKGRIVAGVIRYAIKNKITPIFVTEKPTLYGDMIRDLVDIGSGQVKPLITNSGESVPLDDEALEWYGEAEKAKLTGKPAPKKRGRFLQTKAGEAHKALLSRAAETGNLGEHQVIFTTYNQMQSVQGRTGERHDLLRRFANNGIVIFDESHNAGGGGNVETDKSGEPKFDRAQFARQLARSAKGVLYSSATFAKRPEVMDLYFRTKLGDAVSDLGELSEITSKGGVPMQQVIASMLAEAGQYIRRERSFKGVEYSPTPVKVDRKSAENISRAMRVVADFDIVKQEAVKTLAERVKSEAKRITGDGTVGQAGVSSVNFTSLMHNLIDQSLLAMKVNEAADMAIAALENGEKPVITVANTMGSFIQRFAEEMELQPGAPINLSFNDLLARYLERSREVIVGKPYGEKFRHYLSDEELGEDGVQAYKQAKKFLESINLDIPISPIDWLHKRLREAGYRTGEITGRSHIINYRSDGPVYGTRPASETSTAAKKRTINAFNDGTMDVIILNQSGSTGISLHASEKFKDQRRRHMIIAQAEKNIDTHMQMLGRVHRTGQVIPPRYTQMVADIPAELRPAAVLGKKMASLNANTTASRSSAVTSKDTPDFLNKYGDEVAASLMESDPDLHILLARPLKESERSDGLEREDAMRKVTGRIPLLPIAQQEKVYELLIDEYNDALQQAEAMGENALEAKTLDLQAETTKTQDLVPGSGDSVFEQAAKLEKIRSNRQGKPYPSTEVIEKLQANVGDESGDLQNLQRAGRQKIRAIYSELDVEVAAYKNKAEEEYGDSKRGAIEQLAADKWFGRWRQVVGTVYPGATVQLAGGYGIVLNVERKGKRANPVALSGWRATIAMADSRRQLIVPFSKVELEPTDQPNRVAIMPAHSATVYDPAKEDFASVPIIEAFDKGLSSTKETRYMVTGNLIAGFAAQPNGQIVNFTDNGNRVRQGILMPAKFDPTDVAKQKEKLKTADAVMGVLDDRARGEVSDRAGDLIIRRGPSGGYIFSAASAKGRGGKYYLNKSLLRAAGSDFVKRGAQMEVYVNESAARRMIEVLLNGDGLPTGVVFQAQTQETPRISERRDTPSENYTVADLAQNAKATYRRAANRPGTVYLNSQGFETIKRALEKIYGQQLTPSPNMALDIMSADKVFVYLTEHSGQDFAKFADQLDQAIQDALPTRSDIAFVTRRAGAPISETKIAVRHETVHAAQSRIEQTLRGIATEEWLSRQPKADQIKRRLNWQGYAPESHGFEAVAFVASGEFDHFGMSLDEATQFLDSYYRETVKEYGAEALEEFGAIAPQLQPALERVRDEIRTTRGAAAAGRMGAVERRRAGDIRQGGEDSRSAASSSQGGAEGIAEVPRIAEQRGLTTVYGRTKDGVEIPIAENVTSREADEIIQQMNDWVRDQLFNKRQIPNPNYVDFYSERTMGKRRRESMPLVGQKSTEPGALAVRKPRISERKDGQVSDSKTTPLRDILSGHQPLIADPLKIQDKTLEEILNASGRGVAGSLPGARALYWANKLKMRRVADKLADRQANYLADLIEKTNELIALSDRLGQIPRGVEQYDRTRKQIDNLRVKIAGKLSQAAEYTPAAGYAARIYKSSLLSAPHIHFFNMLEQIFKLPLHEAQRAADALVPAKTLAKFGIPYNKAVTDFRDMVPAIEAEIRGLGRGLKEVPRDVVDMFRYGVTRQMVKADDAEGGFQNSTDKFELGHRAKGIPGLDQALNFIGRSHGAADITFSNIVNATAISAQANAIARKLGKQNGLNKKEIAGLARDLAFEPSAMMIVLADDATLRFKLDYPTLAYDLLQKIRNLPASQMGDAAERGVGKAIDSTWKAAMDFIVPFSKIPLAAVDTYLFRYSPVAFARVAGRAGLSRKSDYTGRYKGEFAKERFSEDTAELFRQGLVGSLSWALLGALGSLGYLQFAGGREDDDDRRNVANLRETMGVGYGPEVRAGNYAFNLNRMGPVGQAAGIGARIYQAQQARVNPKTGEPDDFAKRAGRTAKAAKEGLMFNNPLGQAVKDIAGDDAHSTSVGQFVGGKIRGFVPGIARDIAKIQTPTKKIPDQTSTLGRLKSDMRSGIPGERRKMTDRLDALGRPVPEPNPFAFYRQTEIDPQKEEMERLNVGLPKPRRESGETAEEYNQRLREQAASLQSAMQRIARDSRQAQRSDAAKARIYNTELSTSAMKRAVKLSSESVETEREIEAIRADAYEVLRRLPAYQQMKDSDKETARGVIDAQLKGYRARAASSRAREKVARLPEFDPGTLARMAVAGK